MRKTGRPRLPSALKKLRGTYRPSRAAKNELSPPLKTPDAPPWLDEVALAEWRRVVPMLEELKVLTELDRSMLADYCAAHSLAVSATRAYQSEGLIPKPKRG